MLERAARKLVDYNSRDDNYRALRLRLDTITRFRKPDSRLLGALLFLSGLGGAGAALVWYVRNRTRARIESTARLAVIERLSLGARRELMLVRAGERLLVLASLQQDVKLITALPGLELSEGVEADLDQLLRTSTAAQAPERVEHVADTACVTPSLSIDWPAGPARG